MIAIFTFIFFSIAGSCAVIGTNVIKKRNTNRLAAESAAWSARPVLEGAAWEEFARYIKDDCEGYYLARAAVEALFDNGYRLTCKQIYDPVFVTNDYLGFQNYNRCKEFLGYYKSSRSDAEEKVNGLLLGTDIRMLTQGDYKKEIAHGN